MNPNDRYEIEDWSVTPSGSYCADFDGGRGTFSILFQQDGRVGWAWLAGDEKANGHGFTSEFWRGLQLCAPAPAAAPQFETAEVDDATCARIGQQALTSVANPRTTHADNGRVMIAAVRAELGPTLGLADPARLAELEAALAHLRILARTRFGYAPGDYSGVCYRCASAFIGDKRAHMCPKCADAAIDADRKARAGNGGEG